MGQRRSWRGGTDCNNRVNCLKSLIGNWLEVSRYRTPLQSQSVAVRLSRFDSYLTHKLLKEETRCLDASRIKEHQPSTAEVLRIKLVSGGNVTTRKVVFRMC